MNKTAVVFGATGMVGRELVTELVLHKAYDKVVVVVRRPLNFDNPKLSQVIVPDFKEIAQQKDKLQATDYFCCIGTTIKTAGSREAFRRVDLDIPLLIGQLAQELNIPNLVVVSSIGANAYTGNFYLRTKGEMENAVRNIYKGNLKFVRPSLLMGNRIEYRFGEKVATIFMETFGTLFVGTMKKYRGIGVSTVAKSMINATGLPAEKIFIESDELWELASR